MMDFKISKFDHISEDLEDKLGFPNAAKKIAKILDDMETPNTFGIYGIWGSGKTSLMKLTKNLIDKDGQYSSRIATAWFDPWKYEYEQNVPVVFPLLYEIQKIVQNKDFKQFMKASGKFLVATSLALTAQLKFKTIADDIDKVMESVYSDYERWADHVTNFRDEFEKELEYALKNANKEKLYIFIDDMDRCLQENVIILLEIMKNYLNVKNTVYILGIDHRVIIEHINQKYSSQISFGEEYLNKIIPVSVNIPVTDPIELINTLLSNLDRKVLSSRESEIISKYLERFCGNNKRLSNIIFQKFLISLRYININKLRKDLNSVITKKEDNYENNLQCHIALLRWIIIKEKRPRLFNEYNWVNKYNNLISGNPPKDEFLYSIHWPWYEGDQKHPLTPTIYPQHAEILNRYIDNGLFYP